MTKNTKTQKTQKMQTSVFVQNHKKREMEIFAFCVLTFEQIISLLSTSKWHSFRNSLYIQSSGDGCLEIPNLGLIIQMDGPLTPSNIKTLIVQE